MQDLLRNLVLFSIVAGAVLHLSHRLRLPAVIGLLLAGLVIGPQGLALLQDRAEIEHLADIGIVLLMFSIGLDFTRERLRELVHASGLGIAQMLICIVVTFFASTFVVDRWAECVFLGFLVAHTSSTLMLKLFLDRGELSSPPVRLGLGISITQDLSVLLMLLALPMLATGTLDFGEVGSTLLRIAIVSAVAFLLARWVIPFWLNLVISSQSRELFLIFLIVLCLGTAWATLSVGLSLGLGAFLAGLAIAESGYSHQVTSEVVPFRDLLVSVFFISIGMLLDLGGLREYALPAAAALAFVIAVKFVSGFAPVLAWGYPLRVATTVGLAIAQIGEFSFVLAHAGAQYKLISPEWYQLFLVVAIASMMASPILIGQSGRVASRLARLPGLRRFDQYLAANEELRDVPLAGHAIIGGYGLNGRNVAHALQQLELPYVVLDINPDSVQAARRRGEPVLFGDCSRAEVLRQLQLSTATAFVVAISDPEASRRAIQIARQMNRDLYIVARTRYMSEIDVLSRLGANDVIAEEFETSLEILTLTLRNFGTSRSTIDRTIEYFRADAYQALRTERDAGTALPPEVRDAVEFRTLILEERSIAVGQSLKELDFRGRTGALLVAVQRGETTDPIPPADYRLQAGDRIVLAGSTQQLSNASKLLLTQIEGEASNQV